MRGVVWVAGAFALAGCSYSSSLAITDLSADLKSGSYVSGIRINDVPTDTPSGLQVNLGMALQTALASCATGPHALLLDVSVTRFEAGNAAMAMLLSTSSAIEGSARLAEPATGAVAGDFAISTSTSGSGMMAALATDHAEQSMARAFAIDLCRKAFGRDPDFDHPPATSQPVASIVYPQPNALAQPAPDTPVPWHETSPQ